MKQLNHLSDEVSTALGKNIANVFRVLYTVNGSIETDDGPLELHLENGEVMLFDTAPDGERLRLRRSVWEDPFTQPLSEENKDYVASHGRWARYEVSRDLPYSRLVGHPLEGIELLSNEFGNVAGVTISTQEGRLWFVVEGDESRVCAEQPTGFVAC